MSGEETLALRTVLLPRDTNGAGTIFGGVILSQIDLAGAALAREYSCQRFVTVAMKEVEFHQPVYVGDVVSYFCRTLRIGRTSIRVGVEVWADRFSDPGEAVHVTAAEVTYVNVDEKRRPLPIEGGQGQGSSKT